MNDYSVLDLPTYVWGVCIITVLDTLAADLVINQKKEITPAVREERKS